MLLDDARMIHETTPIQPLADGGFRDTLVVTCRRGASRTRRLEAHDLMRINGRPTGRRDTGA